MLRQKHFSLFIAGLIWNAFLLGHAGGYAQANPKEADEDAIRPFSLKVAQTELDDMKQRILAVRWPVSETVEDRTQGVKLEALKSLADYWSRKYDWRKAEKKLNRFPNYKTRIDGIDIHFIHVPSKEPNALPIIITHGWPGSVFEQLKIILPLTNPRAFGGKAQDAFDVIIPSIPGFGLSEKPKTTGWGPDRVAKAWQVLMKRLGYDHYVAQGGDWGSPVVSAMARQHAEGLLAIHMNLPATVPTEIGSALAAGNTVEGLSSDEQKAFDALTIFFKNYRAYASMMGSRPQTIGYMLADSPVGLAAWMYDYNNGEPERLIPKEDFLDNVSFHWLNNTGTSAARIYWETGGRSVLLAAAQKTNEISIPVAITVFPGEVYQAPESWARQAYKNLAYYNRASEGGHFAAWQVPETFAGELRAAFRFLRKGEEKN